MGVNLSEIPDSWGYMIGRVLDNLYELRWTSEPGRCGLTIKQDLQQWRDSHGYRLQTHERRCSLCEAWEMRVRNGRFLPHRDYKMAICSVSGGETHSNGICDLYRRKGE